MVLSQYDRIIERVFLSKHRRGLRSVPFSRDELEAAAESLGLRRPKNLGDIPYSYRYRRDLPKSVRDKAPKGCEWVIRGAGTSLYRFDAVPLLDLRPNPALIAIKVPDATPGIITRYAQSDEQALLAILRYNRLIDIFVGVTCYSLQNHLSTSVPDIGAVETDEVYVGIDRRGAHYVFPVEAKGVRDRLGRVQIEQDFALCAVKFPDLICRPVGAQFMADNVIALFEYALSDDDIRIANERHYVLVNQDQPSAGELSAYAHLPL